MVGGNKLTMLICIISNWVEGNKNGTQLTTREIFGSWIYVLLYTCLKVFGLSQVPILLANHVEEHTLMTWLWQ